MKTNTINDNYKLDIDTVRLFLRNGCTVNSLTVDTLLFKVRLIHPMFKNVIDERIKYETTGLGDVNGVKEAYVRFTLMPPYVKDEVTTIKLFHNGKTNNGINPFSEEREMMITLRGDQPRRRCQLTLTTKRYSVTNLKTRDTIMDKIGRAHV